MIEEAVKNKKKVPVFEKLVPVEHIHKKKPVIIRKTECIHRGTKYN